MDVLNCDFIFHNIGQGLFYSGFIKSKIKNYEFHFVYDCGTLSWLGGRPFLKNAINNLSRKSNYFLDLVVISHFDSDHVNGLDVLLKKTVVDTIVIPYVSPSERLLIGLSNENQPPWYYSFLSDPIEFLSSDEYRVNRIILLDNDENNNRYDDFFNSNDPNGFNGKNLKITPEQLSDKKIGEIFTKEAKENSRTNYRKALFLNHDSIFLVNNDWEFKFYNHKIDENVIENFYNDLKRNGLNLSKENIVRILINYPMRTLLKDLYKKHFMDVNITSLILYHGPNKPNIDGVAYFRRFLNITHGFPAKPIRFGTLLMGDTDLNYKISDLTRHFSLVLDKIDIVLVPHHGSRHSWNSYLLSQIAAKYWIATYGKFNKFGHPGTVVEEDIQDSPFRKFVKCHELKPFSINFYIHL